MAADQERDRLVDYLLGNLSDDERRGVEEQCLTDDAAYETLLAVENELMYDYAAGSLGAGERRQFEQRLLTSAEQRDRVERARVVVKRLSSVDAQKHMVQRWWLAAAAAVLLAIAGWPVVSRRTEQAEVIVVDRPAPTPPVVETPPSVQPTTFIFATTLRPGLVRAGADDARIVVPPETELLRVTLELPAAASGNYSTYRIILRNAAAVQIGQPITVVPATIQARRVIAVDIPVATLISDDYEIVLSGSAGSQPPADLAEYYATIIRR